MIPARGKIAFLACISIALQIFVIDEIRKKDLYLTFSEAEPLLFMCV